MGRRNRARYIIQISIFSPEFKLTRSRTGFDLGQLALLATLHRETFPIVVVRCATTTSVHFFCGSRACHRGAAGASPPKGHIINVPSNHRCYQLHHHAACRGSLISPIASAIALPNHPEDAPAFLLLNFPHHHHVLIILSTSTLLLLPLLHFYGRNQQPSPRYLHTRVLSVRRYGLLECDDVAGETSASFALWSGWWG